VEVNATGALAPLTEVEVGTEISGIVDSVYVGFNEPVTRGQVLARINTDRIEASTEQARASLAFSEAQHSEAEAGLLQAEADLGRLTRVHELSGGEVPSQAELDAARAAYDRAVAKEASAVAQIAQAQATLDGFLSDLRRARVVSPIDGVVLDRRVEAGQTVAASFQTPVLFTLAGDLRQMQLSVDVDEADVGVVREGQDATFTVDAYPDRTFQAEVAEVRFAPRTVGGVVTYETILTVDNDDLLLRPGMTATAEIVVGRVDDALLVPNAALRFTPSMAQFQEAEETEEGLMGGLIPRPMANAGHQLGRAPRVWVYRDGAPVPVDLEIGPSDGLWTAVSNNELAVGELVITDELEEAG
jgi:HlyD family secretion protein